MSKTINEFNWSILPNCILYQSRPDVCRVDQFIYLQNRTRRQNLHSFDCWICLISHLTNQCVCVCRGSILNPFSSFSRRNLPSRQSHRTQVTSTQTPHNFHFRKPSFIHSGRRKTIAWPRPVCCLARSLVGTFLFPLFVGLRSSSTFFHLDSTNRINQFNETKWVCSKIRHTHSHLEMRTLVEEDTKKGTCQTWLEDDHNSLDEVEPKKKKKMDSFLIISDEIVSFEFNCNRFHEMQPFQAKKVSQAQEIQMKTWSNLVRRHLLDAKINSQIVFFWKNICSPVLLLHPGPIAWPKQF